MMRAALLPLCILVIPALCALPAALAQTPPRAKDAFRNHGVPAQVSECRGAIATADATGNPVIMAMAMDTLNTSLLVINARTGKTQQYWYPKKTGRIGANYCLMIAANGKFYVMLDSVFLEFDLSLRKWTFAENANAGTAMSLTEGPDGTIYAATYPSSNLLAFNPKTRKLTDLGRLDTAQKYPSYLVADSAGWVYAGIGTARSNMVAFNPKTNQRIQLIAEADRVVGSGYFHKGDDGHVYGRLNAKHPWRRFFKGEAETVEQPGPKALMRSTSWSHNLILFPDGSKLAAFDMPGKTFTVTAPKATPKVVTFDYASQGAIITSMIAGPGGKVYGSTCHPFRLFSCDTKSGKLANYGGLKKVGGGNFCGLSVHGDTLFGAAYGGGVLYAYDTNSPWRDSQDEHANPKLLVQFKADIGRPRATLTHPDGRHIIFVGFPGYGRVGGGMAVYDLNTGKAELLTNKRLLHGLSTVTLRALPNGDLIAGTSIHAPGGATPVTKTARLYIMDWKTRKVVFDLGPVENASSISCLEIGPAGKVYGITDTSQFFVFDPDTRKIIHRADFKEYGNPVRSDQTFQLDAKGRLLAIMSTAIVRITPRSYKPGKLATPPEPATVGSAVIGNRLYYAAGSRVWSYRLPR